MGEAANVDFLYVLTRSGSNISETLVVGLTATDWAIEELDMQEVLWYQDLLQRHRAGRLRLSVSDFFLTYLCRRLLIVNSFAHCWCYLSGHAMRGREMG